MSFFDIDFVTLADFIGIIAFALAGILAASEKQVDPVGVFVLAFTTAFGGGIVRDVIIDNRPFYWVANQSYVAMIMLLSACAPFLIRQFKKHMTYEFFIWCDTIGLGFFAVGGTALSLSHDIPLLPATLLGVCTGVFGGLVRDVFLNKVPMVLSDRQPYASSAFLGCWIYIIAINLQVSQSSALWLSTLFIVVLRMFCWYNNLNIVTYGINYDDQNQRKE